MKATLLWVLLAHAALFASCEWEPITRDVQPERLVEGPVHLDRVLDNEARYLLVTRGPRWSIVEWRNRATVCDLPSDATTAYLPLRPRHAGYEYGEEPVIPLLRRSEDDVLELYYTDAKCELRGPYGQVDDRKLTTLTVDDDGRQVTIFRSPDRSLHMVDPWRDTQRKLADDVGGYVAGAIEDGSWPPRQGLWILESGKLVQRALDGEQVLSLGTDVSEFSAQYDRVAYVDGGDLYEAGSPNYSPQFVAEDGCSPRYGGGLELEFYSPCEARQLMRQEYFSRTLETFAEGVYRIYELDLLRFEYARDDDGAERMFVATPENPLRPDLAWQRRELPWQFSLCQGCVRSLGGDRYAILATDYVAPGESEPAGSTLGIWSSEQNTFTPVFRQAGRPYPVDWLRSAATSWLLVHDTQDRIGTLSLMLPSSLSADSIVPLADQVPLGAFSVETHTPQAVNALDAPLLVYVGDAVPAPDSRAGYRGTLSVKLVDPSQESLLGGPIAKDVSSFRAVVTPIPGVLYGVEEGPDAGLWFAAL